MSSSRFSRFSNSRPWLQRSLAISCLSLGVLHGAAQAQPATATEAQAFVDRMITCNSHSLLLSMYAQGQIPATVPPRAPYRDIAYSVGGERNVAERLISEDELNKALAELEPLLNAKSPEGMSEQQKDEHTYGVWSKIIEGCNAAAARPPKSN